MIKIKSIEDFPEFLKLTERINKLNPDINCQISIVDACYQYSDNKLKSFCGPIGWISPGLTCYPDVAHGLTIKITSDTATINQLVSADTLEFPKETKRTDEKSAFELTQGFNYNVQKMSPKIIDKKLVPRQIFKTKYYDAVLEAVRKINPDFTEEQLIDEWTDNQGYTYHNGLVVENIVQEHYVNITEENNNSSLSITLVLENIENNSKKVLDVVKYYNSIIDKKCVAD